MESIIHADIFFFITTIAVVILTVIITVASFYLIQILKNFRDISKVLKNGVNNAEENIGEMYHNIEESSIFRFIFGKKKKENKHK